MNYTIRQKKIIILELVYSITMIVIGAVLPIVLINHTASDNHAAIYGLQTIAVAGLSLQFYTYLTKSKRRILRVYLIAALLSLPILLFAAI